MYGLLVILWLLMYVQCRIILDELNGALGLIPLHTNIAKQECTHSKKAFLIN